MRIEPIRHQNIEIPFETTKKTLSNQIVIAYQALERLDKNKAENLSFNQINKCIKEVEILKNKIEVIYDQQLGVRTPSECAHLQRLNQSLERISCMEILDDASEEESLVEDESLNNIISILGSFNENIIKHSCNSVFSLIRSDDNDIKLKYLFDDLKKHLNKYQ
jgi:DNA-binding Xre family transcriptional regulator